MVLEQVLKKVKTCQAVAVAKVSDVTGSVDMDKAIIEDTAETKGWPSPN